MADEMSGGGAISAGVVYMDVLPRMTKFVGAVNGQLARAGTAMSAAGRGLTRGLTLPIVGAGAAMFMLSRDFERSMALIGGLVGTNERQLGVWKERILELGGKLPQTPNELAQALYFVASSGFEGDAAFKVMTVSARAAAAGLGDVQTVADAVTSAVSAFGPKTLSAAAAADVLVATVREGKGEADQLAGAIGRVIPVASNIGVAFHEVGAALASMTLNGLDSYEATTALRGIFQSFVKPTQAARDTLEDLGLSIQGVRKSIKEEGLFATLMGLRGEIGNNQDALGKIIPNVRALNGFLSLTGERAGKNSKIFEDLTDNLGDTDRAVKVMARTTDFKLKTAMSNLQSTAIRFGDIIAPGVQKVVKQLSRAVTWFGNLDKGTKKSVVKWAAYAAALGPVLWITGKLVRLLSGMIGIVFRLGKGVLFLGKMMGLSTLATIAWTAALVAAGMAVQKIMEFQDMDEKQGHKWAKGLEDGTISLVKARYELEKLEGDQFDPFGTSAKAANALRIALDGYNRTFADTVRETLAGTKVGDRWLELLRSSDGMTVKQKNNLAGLLVTTERYNVKLNDSQRVTLEAFLATGDYKSALRLLRNALNNVLGPLKNIHTWTQKNAEVMGIWEQKSKRQLDWLRSLGNLEPLPDFNIPVGPPPPGGGGGQTEAGGTRFFKGGWTRVGEFGAEHVFLPRGSRVLPASMSSSEDSGGPRRLSGKLVLVGGKAYVEGIIDTDDREKSRHARRRARM